MVWQFYIIQGLVHVLILREHKQSDHCVNIWFPLTDWCRHRFTRNVVYIPCPQGHVRNPQVIPKKYWPENIIAQAQGHSSVKSCVRISSDDNWTASVPLLCHTRSIQESVQGLTWCNTILEIFTTRCVKEVRSCTPFSSPREGVTVKPLVDTNNRMNGWKYQQVSKMFSKNEKLKSRENQGLFIISWYGYNYYYVRTPLSSIRAMHTSDFWIDPTKWVWFLLIWC